MSASNAPPAWSNPNSSPLASSEVHEVPSAGDDDFLTRPYSTLDEPVMETIMRDARSVGGKLRVVLFPLSKAVCYIRSLIMVVQLHIIIT